MVGAWIGIDVGGTFTDGVAVRGGEVVATVKVPTEVDALEHSLLGAIDGLLERVAPLEVVRVSLSTTLTANLLAQKRVPDVALLLIPGPGRNPASYRLPGRYWVVRGAIDFRGREVVPLDPEEVRDTLREIHEAGFRKLAVVGKFSPRNPSHEHKVVEWARKYYDDWGVCAGHTASGQLNFPRRATATALTLIIEEPYRLFFNRLVEAFRERALHCPVVILKADGGTLPLEAAGRAPLQSIFSGPAASTMGALALRPPGATSVVVDVGGTTTDLALILDGTPLLAGRGAVLDEMPLPTRAFAVCSLAVGGDHTATIVRGRVVLLPTRAGMAACLGGPEPTLTDALLQLGYADVGDPALGRAALARLGDPGAVAATLVEQALSQIEVGIEKMFETWRCEPVYRLWELRQKGRRRPDVLVGIGAAAASIVPQLARRLGARDLIPSYASVANALGAAVARSTYTTTVRIDTERRTLEVAETGVSVTLPSNRLNLEDARILARDWALRRGTELGIEMTEEEDVVEVLAEQFNVVSGWRTVGRIFDIQLERRCGLVSDWQQRKDG